ncbi:hypothetical protein CCP4SC76_4190003 [Gammaproteobacteria bacterium]
MIAGALRLSKLTGQNGSNIPEFLESHNGRKPIADEMSEFAKQEIDFLMKKHAEQFGFADGGKATGTTDTIPAMLTPGEFVINKSAVQKMGAGFFDDINNMRSPVRAMAEHIRGFNEGGLVYSGREQVSGDARDAMRSEQGQAASKTIRVELASGTQKVNASIAQQDESRFLEVIKQAQSRSW